MRGNVRPSIRRSLFENGDTLGRMPIDPEETGGVIVSGQFYPTQGWVNPTSPIINGGNLAAATVPANTSDTAPTAQTPIEKWGWLVGAGVVLLLVARR